MASAADRVASLDLIRGVAVLGILAVNIAGFAGPSAATVTPHALHTAGWIDEASFAAVFVLFEGKMRALFTLLFGASLTLFIDKAEAGGRDGEILQFRRLTWLLLFGLLHYFLFWWGDILFLYALSGIAVLFLRQIPTLPLVLGALLAFFLAHLAGTLDTLAGVYAEEQVRLGSATLEQARLHAEFIAGFGERTLREMAEFRMGFLGQIGVKLGERPFYPFEAAWSNMGETIPLMLIGHALQRSGFFAGQWPRARLLATAGAAYLAGLAITLAMLSWLWERHFPLRAASAAVIYWAALPHLLMAFAYAALLTAATPALLRSRLGQRLASAGRMAFTNYIACTVMMTAVFYGWGFGLVGTIGHSRQILFVIFAWALMLAWSKPWLAHFRQGPLEWLWRSLTERKLLPLRIRSSQST